MGWSGRAPAPPAIEAGKGRQDKEHAMSQTLNAAFAVVGIDIGKTSFHIVGHDERGAIVLRQKWSRGQVEARLANMPLGGYWPSALIHTGLTRARGSMFTHFTPADLVAILNIP